MKLLGEGDEFFQGVFDYLKRKFVVRRDTQTGVQKNTEHWVYHESIVALELVHKVLRKVENGSAPTREDYERAVRENHDERKQEIINFYKNLTLIDDNEYGAFQNFRRHYFFDEVIRDYSRFLDEYTNPDANEPSYAVIRRNGKADTKTYEKLSRLVQAWDLKSFEANKLFQFIEGYQAMLVQALPPDSRSYKLLSERIDQQNTLHDNLVRDYDELVSKVKRIGITVVDVTVPYSAMPHKAHESSYFTQQLTDIIRELEIFFQCDDGILLVVNHTHVMSNNNFILSYLLIYKANIYQNPTTVFERVNKELTSIVGRLDNRVKVKNCEEMITSLYPNNNFVGELSNTKQKTEFRDKFLKYFLSCVFVIDFEKDEELERWASLKDLTLNDYIPYKEKIYINQEIAEKKRIISIEKKALKKPIIQYLDQLVDADALSEPGKYFSSKDLPSAAIQQLELIKFLYMQQASTKASYDIIADLLMIEAFLARLMYLPTYELSGTHTHKSFEDTPKWVKLSRLFQQYLLISQMSCVTSKGNLPRELSGKAIFFVKHIWHYLEKDYKVDQSSDLKIDLEKYKRNKLRSAFQHEQQALKQASKKMSSIQGYLQQVLKNDVVIVRFIFKCGDNKRYNHNAEKFDEMFRDFTNNLKRRYTAGFRLDGYVGVYIPHELGHYIDATLFFQKKQRAGNSIEDLQNGVEALQIGVTDYWGNYVKYKHKQIQVQNSKKKIAAPNGVENPFSCFENQNLTAQLVPVVKTENALNHNYVELFKAAKNVQSLLIEKVSLFYAYSPVILIYPTEYKSLPRKNCLILGRVHKPRKKDAVTDEPQNALNAKHEQTNSLNEIQATNKLSDQTHAVSELNPIRSPVESNVVRPRVKLAVKPVVVRKKQVFAESVADKPKDT